MKPLGIQFVRFPGKRKQWLGRGVLMWWEDWRASKKRDRRDGKQQAQKGIGDD